MKIAVTGSSGLVGRALCAWLIEQGHEVVLIIRPRSGREKGVVWDIHAGKLSAGELAGVEALVHLAGANIAGRRWSAAYKREIRESRVLGTRLLAETAARVQPLPKVMISMSAVGYYGARSEDELLDEDSSSGEGFLSEVCRDWEQAASPAALAGVRVVHPRLGMVLSKEGGALARMLPPFRLGLGGPLGSGRQMMSWIALDDIPPAIGQLISDERIAGPVNLVSPNPVSNAEFSRVLGRVLGRPAVLPLPAFAARVIFGEMADALLLTGSAVYPRRLEDSGYSFRYADLEAALRHHLSRLDRNPSGKSTGMW